MFGELHGVGLKIMNTHFSIGEPPVLGERYFEYYKDRAKGGVGLIITTHVKAEKKVDPYPLTYGYATLDSVNQIKYFYEITEMAHRYDAKIAIELSPGTGRLADDALEGKWPVGPSENGLLGNPEIKTRELTKDEIAELVQAYGKAAGLAKQAGFDIIYVHFIAYLGDQFLSSVWNRRTDEYGGSLENRMRFLLECIESTRANVGSNVLTFTQIAGSGQVVNVDVQAGADNTSIETPNTEITVVEGVLGVTGAGQAEIAGGTTVRNNAEGTGIITPEPTPPIDDEDEDETDPVETTLSMGADDLSIETGEQFTMPINVKGTVADDDEDNMVRLYAVISGLSADDIELEAIEGGTPAIVTDEAELGYVGAQEGDIVLAWGPTEGFPLLASDFADNGLTSSFVATINKVGNYAVKFVFYDLDGQKQLNDKNDSVSITVTEVTEEVTEG